MEDEPIQVAGNGVLLNDQDPDGDALTAVLVEGPSSGSLQWNGDGSFRYDPAADFFGEVTFTYRAADATSESNLAVVTLTINGVNDAPEALVDAYETMEDQSLEIVAPGLLLNDQDVEGDDLQAVLITSPQHGQLDLISDGSFVYTPDRDFFGEDSFSYQADDGSARSETAEVTITIQPVNDAPETENDAYSGDEDESIVVESPGVLANDSDVEGSPLTAVLVDGPAVGQLQLADDGSFVFDPPADYFGEVAFSYQATDGDQTSEPATAWLTIRSVNDAPVAVDDAYETNEDEMLVLDSPGVLANDFDVDGDDLQLILVSPPTMGELELQADGGFTYTPYQDANGVDQFLYQLSDGELESAVRTADVTVRPINDPPLLSVTDAELVQHRWRDVMIGVSDVDIGDSEIQFTATSSNGLLRIREDVVDGLQASQISGNESAELFVTAPLAALQATLAAEGGLQAYTATVEVMNLGVVADDLGASGAGAGRIEASREFTPQETLYPWANLDYAYDVDGDGVVIPRDVQKLLSDIIINGSRVLPTPGPEGPYDYLDVFRDNQVTPQDLVLVLNEIFRLNEGEGAKEQAMGCSLALSSRTDLTEWVAPPDGMGWRPTRRSGETWLVREPGPRSPAESIRRARSLGMAGGSLSRAAERVAASWGVVDRRIRPRERVNLRSRR